VLLALYFFLKVLVPSYICPRKHPKLCMYEITVIKLYKVTSDNPNSCRTYAHTSTPQSLLLLCNGICLKRNYVVQMLYGVPLQQHCSNFPTETALSNNNLLVFCGVECIFIIVMSSNNMMYNNISMLIFFHSKNFNLTKRKYSEVNSYEESPETINFITLLVRQACVGNTNSKVLKHNKIILKCDFLF